MPFARTAFTLLFAACLSQAVAVSQLPLPQAEPSVSTNPALAQDWADRLLANDAKIRATAEASLVEGARRSLPLLRRFLDPDSENLHLVTLEIIRRIGPPAIPLLVDLLRHESLAVRRDAVDALIDLAPDTESIQAALRQALTDEDSTVAGDAARALGALGKRATPSVGALVKTLSHDDPYVRVYAAEAMASIGPSAATATNALAEALGDPIPGVRWAACEALASIGPAAQSAVPQLIEALKDEFLYVRIFAAGALGSIGPKARSAREALEAAANDPALRDEAEWALTRIAGVKSAKPVASRALPAPSVAPTLETRAAPAGNPPADWDTTTGRNIVWSVELGNETYGRPVVAGDAVYIGTDNARHLNPAYQEEAGVLVALRAKDGTFLWQDVAPRVERGLREFLLPSTTSTPYVEGNRLYYVTSECQLRSLDTQGFRDGENNGPYRDEIFKDDTAADIVWELDMCGRLGVFAHEATNSEVLPVGDLLMVSTSERAERRPHARPIAARPKPDCGGQALGRSGLACHWPRRAGAARPVVQPGGSQMSMGAYRCSSAEETDGCVPTTRRLVTKSGDSTAIRRTPAGFRDPGVLSRSSITASPVFADGRVFVAMGQSPGHGNGPSLVHAIQSQRHRATSPRAGSSGRLARSVGWWERPLRTTVFCTSATWVERFTVWTRRRAPLSGSTTRTRPSGEASCWPGAGFTSGTSKAR